MHSVADPQVHPDGQRIAFTVTTPDLEDDTYVKRIHLWESGVGARRFTNGAKDGTPRWSPDGTHLAFLRTGPGDDDEPQLAVLRTDGGEARVLTELSLGVTDLAWSPDSTQIVVVGIEWTTELADLDDDERKRRPRRITRIPYRADDVGWTHDRRSHLWLVDIDGDTAPRCLTPGDFNETAPRFREDGAAVVFLSQRHDDRETRLGEEVYEITLGHSGTRMLTDSGLWSPPVPLSDGTVLLTGLADPYDWPSPPTLLRREPDGTLTSLAGDLDRDVVAPAGPVLTKDGFLAMVQDRGRVHVYRFAGDGTYQRIVAGDQVVTGVSASPDGTVLAYTTTALTDPGELWRMVDGNHEVLTDVNADLRNDGNLVGAAHLTVDRDDHDIDAWLLLPPDADEHADLPLLLCIHGGPTAQYGFGFFDEFQIYASAGYAVLGLNPRGSSGRGRDWSHAVVGTWTDHGSVDALDLEAAVNTALAEQPQVSRDRIGVMGGSYGGFATTRLLARSERFASAVVERALLNFVSFGGTSDIGPNFDRLFLRQTLPDDAADLWTASPLAVAHRITTPTLILHSEQDLRCPIEQAEQLFSLLRRRGVDAEFLRFPGESHELSRSGAPKHRIERFEAILDWHDRHLGAPPQAE
jgi:dipeptidyl aminopeptidase/acylaminoacyl peptidase